jgi:dipeptidyl aminopeptidase/acylaminoacyl peptidase
MGRGRLTLGAAGALALVLVAAHAALGAAAPVRTIVFSAHPNGQGGDLELFSVQTNGEGLKQLTNGGGSSSAPAFSRDGRQIAFSRLGSGIWRMNADGTGLRRVSSGGRDSYPAWSPDGTRIAFVRPYRTDWRLYVISSTGRGVRRLAQAPPAGRPTWTANGRSIFIPAAGDLVRVDVRTGRIQRYYGLTLDLVLSATATLSPGARRIAYLAHRTPTGPEDCGEGPCPQFGLYLANVVSPHRPRRIVNDCGPAAWSPDGGTLAYVWRGALTLWSVTTGKRIGLVRIGEHVPAGDAPPAWQPR